MNKQTTPDIFDNHVRYALWQERAVDRALPVPKLLPKNVSDNKQWECFNKALLDTLYLVDDIEIQAFKDRKRWMELYIAGYLQWKSCWTKGYAKRVKKTCLKVSELCRQLEECLSAVDRDDAFNLILQDSLNDLMNNALPQKGIFDFMEEKYQNLSDIEFLFGNVNKHIKLKYGSFKGAKDSDGETEAFKALLSDLIDFYETVNCHAKHNHSPKEIDINRFAFVCTVLYAFRIKSQETRPIYKIYKSEQWERQSNGENPFPSARENKLIRTLQDVNKQYQANLQESLQQNNSKVVSLP